MQGVNKHIIVGTIGSDIEYRTIGENSAVANFSVATNRSYTGKNGERTTETQWHRIEAWNRLADIARQYAGKGKHVYIEGEVRHEQYEKDGITRYSTKTIATTTLNILSPKSDGGETTTAGEAKQQVDSLKKEAPQQNALESEVVNENAFVGDSDENDDDLPF